MNKTILAILMLFQISVVDAAAADLWTEDATIIEDPIRLVVKLKTFQIDENRPSASSWEWGGDCPSANSWRWGSEWECPQRRISALEVAFEKQAVFIPYSAFSDLGNPGSIQIERSAKDTSYSIKIRGGDAATSYSAVLKFKSGLLLERIVRSGEFPSDAWEKTIYKFNTEER
jgi:hypothetical protein